MEHQNTPIELINLAHTLLRTRHNIYMEEMLVDVMKRTPKNSDEELRDLQLVLAKINEDGYDMNGFGLWEIPHENVYCFVDESRDRAFDVYIYRTEGADDYATIGYINGSEMCDAESIAEAISKYDF